MRAPPGLGVIILGMTWADETNSRAQLEPRPQLTVFDQRQCPRMKTTFKAWHDLDGGDNNTAKAEPTPDRAV
jgi:hypothetical protein